MRNESDPMPWVIGAGVGLIAMGLGVNEYNVREASAAKKAQEVQIYLVNYGDLNKDIYNLTIAVHNGLSILDEDESTMRNNPYDLRAGDTLDVRLTLQVKEHDAYNLRFSNVRHETYLRRSQSVK